MEGDLSPELMAAVGAPSQPGPPQTLAETEDDHRPPPPGPECFPGSQRITADAVICRGPCVLYSAVLTDDTVGNADATLYEGANTGGRRLFTLRAAQNATGSVDFRRGVYLEGGLYVDVGSNVLEVFLVYATLPG